MFAKMAGQYRLSILGIAPRSAAHIAALRSLLLSAAILAGLFLPVSPVRANWLTKLVGGSEQVAGRGAKSGARALDGAVARIKALPPKVDGAVLAAQDTQEGHWRFVNKSGETFTAGTPEEMKRVGSVLFPELKPETRLSLYLTQDTLFLQRDALKHLPRGAEFNIVVGRESYRLLKNGDGASERFYAEVRPNLVVELTEQARFAEAIWQLARPLNKSNIRILALDPAGPPRLASAPRIDPVSKKAMIDTIDPASLPAALGAVRGQTVLVTGRIDGRLLYFKPSSGAERSLLVTDLFKAAEDADVNLMLLQSPSTPRQPGGRNWLWQRVQVKGLDEALTRARMADFLNALASANGRFGVVARPSGGLRTVLEIKPVASLPRGPSAPIGDVFSEIVSDLTGKVITNGVQASVRSAERQQELDQRLIPGLPSDFQVGYLALMLVGLLGVPVSRAWWRRVWPPEFAGEYAGPAGYWAARVIRGAAFILLFLPLTAPVTAPYNLFRQVWEAATAPLRWWRRLVGRTAVLR